MKTNYAIMLVSMIAIAVTVVLVNMPQNTTQEVDELARRRKLLASTQDMIKAVKAGKESMETVSDQVELLYSSTSRFDRLVALDMIRQMGAPLYVWVDRLCALVRDDQNHELQVAAVRALEGIGPNAKRAIPTLTTAFERFPERKDLRYTIIRALGEMASGEDREVISFLDHVQQSNPELSTAASYALGRLKARTDGNHHPGAGKREESN